MREEGWQTRRWWWWGDGVCTVGTMCSAVGRMGANALNDGCWPPTRLVTAAACCTPPACTNLHAPAPAGCGTGAAPGQLGGKVRARQQPSCACVKGGERVESPMMPPQPHAPAQQQQPAPLPSHQIFLAILHCLLGCLPRPHAPAQQQAASSQQQAPHAAPAPHPELASGRRKQTAAGQQGPLGRASE